MGPAKRRAGFGLWALAAALLVAGRAGAAPDGVSLSAASRGVRFRVEVPEPRLIPDADGLGARVELPGYDARSPHGGPALPERVLMVAVPPTGEIALRATASEREQRDGVTLRVEDRLRFERAGPADQAPARLLDVSWLRNQRVARVLVSPVRWEEAEHRLTVARGIEVAIEVAGAGVGGAPIPGRDAFESVYRDVLVNYEQGRSWRRGAADGIGGRTAGRDDETGRIHEVEGVVPAGVFAGRNWIKITIERSGFYKVDYRHVRSLAPFAGDTTIVSDSLRLFAWPGLPVLDEGNYCDDCDYREAAIGVVDDGDGRFSHDADAFYFYALGPSDWADAFDATAPDTTFINHPYETRSFYYLTVSDASYPVPGPYQRIGLAGGAVAIDGDEVAPVTFTERAHFEVDAEYLPAATPGPTTAFWEKWFWQSLEMGGGFSTGFDAPGIEPNPAARLRARVWGLRGRDTCFRPLDPPDHVVDVKVNGADIGRFGWDNIYFPAFIESPFTVDTPVSGVAAANNVLRIEVPVFPTCRLREDDIAVAWFDVFYPRRFEPAGESLVFRTPPAGGSYLFDVGPFASTTPPRLFDVTDPGRPFEIQGFGYGPGTGGHRLTFERAQAGARRYHVLPDTAIARVPNGAVNPALATSLVDLRSETRSADYLVIYYDEFKAAADTLTAWRHARLGFETMIVPVSALFDQFSGGRTDPAALRNFLRVTYTTWAGTPGYVTFLGDASYDFKNLTGRAAPGRPGALLPTYENGFDLGHQYSTDDWILNVDNPAVVVPDFLGGRLPAGDADVAMDMVRGKVLRYERSAPLGIHRNRVMLMADDQEQASRDDLLRWAHVSQSAELDSTTTPRHIDRDYVYIHTYPDAPGDTKPAAKSAVLSGLNGDGVTLFNYVGHGSPFKMTDESVFLDTDVGALNNFDRLTVFVAASCDIGKYDDPAVRSLGELLLARTQGGAVAVISATELALSGQNAQLNREIFRRLFLRAPGGGYQPNLAAALLAGKSGTVNSQKYQLMGDAATELALPEWWIETSLWDSAGTTPVTAIRQGETITFKGTVVEAPGGPPLALDGVVSMLIEDSAPLEKTPDCPLAPGCSSLSYYYTAGPMYRGEAEVTGGSFQGRFVVPLDARIGPNARARGYATGLAATRTSDAVGNARVSLDPGAARTDDRDGPRIGLSFSGGATTVRPDAVLRVDLYDPSGILITEHTPQNGIVVTVDGNTTNRTEVTDSFRYAAGSFTSGAAHFQLPGLATGPHNVRVSAADNLAAGLAAASHRSSATIEFSVEEVPPLRIARAYMFPNPVRSGEGGAMVVDAPGDSVNVLIRIYTVSGRLIRTLRHMGGLGQVQVPWDGLDEEGQGLANGVYVFKVHANVREEDGSSSPRQKADTEGRFAIVNDN